MSPGGGQRYQPVTFLRLLAFALASIAVAVLSSIATVHFMTMGRGPRNLDPAVQKSVQPKPRQPSARNSSHSHGCSAGHVSRAWTRDFGIDTTSGKTCGFSSFPEYTACRMRSGNGKLYGHFADRLWVNQWRRSECCGALVPKITHFFAATERERAKRCLQEFVAPAPGAVMKLNHKAGDVTGRKPLLSWAF